MEIEKYKVSIQSLQIFRQSGDVLFFLYARRLRGYTATDMFCNGLICLNRNTNLNICCPKLPYLVLLKKIILVVF